MSTTVVNRKSVSMFVYNNCKSDSRVLKEAKSLSLAGYSVRIFALLTGDVPSHEQREGFEIIRVIKRPLHYRIFFIPAQEGGSVVKKEPASPISIWLKKLRSAEPGKYARKYFREKPISSILIGLVPFILYMILLLVFKSLGFIYRWMMVLVKRTVHEPLCYMDFYNRTFKIIRSNPSFIYHCHDLNTLWVGYKCKKKFNGRLVYDSHELYVERNVLHKPSEFKKKLLRRFEKFLTHQCDLVITVGDCIAQYLSDLYQIRKPAVIMNAPSKKIFSATGNSLREMLQVPNEMKLLVYSGSITFNRGLEKLIESMQHLHGYFLVFLGYGNETYKNRLQQLANDLGVQDRFRFYGPVLPHEVTGYVAGADLGLAPIENACLSYYYCAPNKVFEYLLGGIPVAASDFPELKKIINELHVGSTFNPDDAAAIAQSIKSVFDDERRYSAMKQNTKNAAVLFNWENEEKKLLSAYSILA